MSGPQQATFTGKDPKAANEVEKQAQDIQRQQESNQGGAAGREGVASTNPSDYDARGGTGGGSMAGELCSLWLCHCSLTKLVQTLRSKQML